MVFAVVSLALFALLALPSAGTAAERVWLAVEAPEDGDVLEGSVGLVEVRGRAGVGIRAAHDVVIALDLSGSTFLASGSDVDGDGAVGRTSGWVERLVRRGAPVPFDLGPRQLSSDPGDTVRAAQLAAARKLFQALDFASTRVGLVTFDHAAQIAAGVGTSREALLGTLDRIEREDSARAGATDFQAAIRAGMRALREAPEARDERRRAIVFLSDGQPTHPPPPSLAAQRAIEAAAAAGRMEVRIFAYALGPEAVGRPEVYGDLAELSGGRTLSVERPGEIVGLLSQIDLAGIADVGLENVTLGERGLAVRVFRDGSFDGFLKLAPGGNRLRATARGSGGAEIVEERTVFYAERVGRDETESARSRELLERLRTRTLELELQREIERAQRPRRDQEKQLDLSTEE